MKHVLGFLWKENIIFLKSALKGTIESMHIMSDI